MSKNWFVRKGMFFLPVSLTGWILLSAALLYCVYLFVEIDSRSHSASDTLRNFVFNAIIVFVVYSVIGFFTNRIKK
jgi:hypothetical protein